MADRTRVPSNGSARDGGEMRATASGEPKCPGCGEPMVHNSWMEQWECADAFFGLNDDGVLAGGFVLLPLEDLTPVQRVQYEHWRYWIVPDAEWEMWQQDQETSDG